MAYFSPATKEITAKIVYYGPGMCGKTTNLQKVHELMRPQMKSDLLSVATETDRTIYFDFLPLKLGKIAGFEFQVRVFTVPGQPYYAETRRIVLQGADGVVFVADGQRFMLDQNRDSLLDLKKNLRANGLDYDTIPMVLQFNKQDLGDLTPPEDLEAALNDRKVKTFLASAYTGQNIIETLKYVTLSVFRHVRDSGGRPGGAKRRRPAAPAKPKQAQPAPTASPAASLPATSQPATSQPAATGQATSQQAPPQQAAPLQTAAAGAENARKTAPAAATPLEHLVDQVVEGSDANNTSPMPSTEELATQEFKNMVVLHHQLVERVATLESDIKKMKNDYRDIKALLGRRLR